MKSPIKKPYIYDTPQGIDHVIKTLEEDNIENLTPFKKDQLDKLNRDMKLSLLKAEEASVKKFVNEDPSTYPSNPEQRGRLMNIQALEKSLGIPHDSSRSFKKTGALPLAEKKPDMWKDVIYKSMSPIEKGQWNSSERKKGYDGKTGSKLQTKPQKEIFKPVDLDVISELTPVIAQPEKSVEEIIKEKADERLKREQDFYDRENGTQGIVALTRPD